MKPVSPVIPGEDVPEIVIAKDQPEYKPLPAIVGEEGTVLTRWRCSLIERFRVFFTGNIYVYVMTFRQPLQPLQLDTKKPTYTTTFAFKRKLKDWFKRSFNFDRKFGWMKTPRGWLVWDWDGAPRVYWSKDMTPTPKAKVRVLIR